MCGRQLAFYRSHVVHVAFILTGIGMAFALSPLAPSQWRQTPSLLWLHRLLPWNLLCAGFVVYVLLLLWGTVLPTLIADFLGLFMYGCELVALLATLHVSHRTNPFAIAGLFLACVLHFAAARLATLQEARG